MEPVVRVATRADSEAVARVHERSIRELAAASYSPEVIAAWASGKDPTKYPIESDEAYFVVAEVGDQIVGFGEFRPDPDDYFHANVDGEIRAVYVHPNHARQGISAAMYRELECEARRHGLASLGLWASINAVEFYEALGFEAVEEFTHEFGGEVEGPAVEMKKTL